MHPKDPLYRKPKQTWLLPGLGIIILSLAYLAYQLPAVQDKLGWRLEIARTFLRLAIHPIPEQPTVAPLLLPTNEKVSPSPPKPTTGSATHTPVSDTPTSQPSPTAAIASPTPLPIQVILPPPPFEAQDWNNCGPAALSMFLNFYQWEGTQNTIAEVIKPFRNDRNVNIDELLYFARSQAGWLTSFYRVGGNVDFLKKMIAAGIPVLIESTFWFDEAFWFDDDLWGGHYLLITGYDDQKGIFITQNSFQGANLEVSYDQVDKDWQAFNRAYLLIYPPDKEAEVTAILDANMDPAENRKLALETSRMESEADPDNVFAWFNLGTNLAYFEDYQGAVLAYDKARQIGLPQRMLRYQFGPFLAYFHAGRNDDLLALSEYALQITPNAEEALLWNGWGLYRAGEKEKAIQQFQAALKNHPGYVDAEYALTFMAEN